MTGIAPASERIRETDMTPADVVEFIKEKEVKYCDLRFTDTRGKEQHVTVPTRMVDEACSTTARCSTAPRSPAGRASTSPT